MLSAEEAKLLFWYAEDAEPVLAFEPTPDSQRRSLLYENAYMLLYSKVGSKVCSEDVRAVISTELKDQVMSENERFKSFQLLYEYHANLVDVSVYDGRRTEFCISPMADRVQRSCLSHNLI